MATTFTPLLKGFSWAPSTIDVNGSPLPSGEVSTGLTIGIRADGVGSAGVYTYLIVVPSNATSETLAQVNTAIGKALVPGNYWAAIDQTDMLSGASSTSPWTSEIPFSIPSPAPVIAQPASPTGFTVA